MKFILLKTQIITMSMEKGLQPYELDDKKNEPMLWDMIIGKKS